MPRGTSLPIEIELPDGTVLEAPDGADPSTVAKAYMAKQSKPKKPGFLEAARLTMSPNTRARFGAGEAALSVATGMVSTPLNHFWNAGMEAMELPTGEPVGTYQPRTPEGQAALSGVGKAMEATGLPWLMNKGLDLENPDPAVRASGNAIAGLMGVIPGIGTAKSLKAGRAAIPTRPEIKAASSAAYKRAEQSGGMLPQSDLGGFVQQAEKMLGGEAFDKGLHPNTLAALTRLYEDASNPQIAGHSVQGAEVLRRVIASAETKALKSPDGADDARLAGKLLDDFDDFVEQQLPTSSAEYRQARTLWNVQRKSQDIEQLFERAQNQAGQFSVSGMENALRTQFKQLADNPRRFRRFSEDERSAILKVVRGGPVQHSLRLLGKFAPTGTVPAIASLAAEGVVPGLGLGLAATGLAGRAGASFLRNRAATSVDELIRSKAVPAMGPGPARGQPLPQLGYLPAASLAIEPPADQSFADWLLQKRQ
jgi:plasmid stabilization system protein ParE